MKRGKQSKTLKLEMTNALYSRDWLVVWNNISDADHDMPCVQALALV